MTCLWWFHWRLTSIVSKMMSWDVWSIHWSWHSKFVSLSEKKSSYSWSKLFRFKFQDVTITDLFSFVFKFIARYRILMIFLHVIQIDADLKLIINRNLFFYRNTRSIIWNSDTIKMIVMKLHIGNDSIMKNVIRRWIFWSDSIIEKKWRTRICKYEFWKTVWICE